MNKPNFIQAGYHILMCMAVLDGSYKSVEGKIIVNFVTKYEDNDNFDIDAENIKLQCVGSSNLLNHTKQMVVAMNETTSDVKDKIALLQYAYEVAIADKEISEKQEEALRYIGLVLNVPTEPLFTTLNI